MSLTVVGSIAFDQVKTPFGSRERMLGGAATHFALAASFFDEVHAVGVVGGDFGAEEMGVFERHGVDTSDIERVEGGETFFWRGRYDFDLNTAHTLDTQLNVFADFKPKLSEESRRARMVFLGNIQPELQSEVREQSQVSGRSERALRGHDGMDPGIQKSHDAFQELLTNARDSGGERAGLEKHHRPHDFPGKGRADGRRV